MMKNGTYFTYDTVHGKITIVSDGEAITQIKHEGKLMPECEKKETVLIKQAFDELNEYFSGKRFDFDVPIRLHGTDFHRSVWEALMKIPYGETRTYKQVAEIVGRPKASRAVGQANNRNPIWIIIPCHRVIGASGKLTGYDGGVEMKEKLLELERRT